jgi:hypothetical protein
MPTFKKIEKLFVIRFYCFYASLISDITRVLLLQLFISDMLYFSLTMG